MTSYTRILLDFFSFVSFSGFLSSRRIYHLHVTPATWNEARRTCEEKGFRLLTVNSPRIVVELKFLKNHTNWVSYLNTDYWIGLHASSSCQYRWADCSQLGPDPLWSGGDKPRECMACVRGDIESGKWKSTACEKTYPFICMKQQRSCIKRSSINTCMDPGGRLTFEEKVNMSGCQLICQHAMMEEQICHAYQYNFSSEQCGIHMAEIDRRAEIETKVLSPCSNVSATWLLCMRSKVVKEEPAFTGDATAPLSPCFNESENPETTLPTDATPAYRCVWSGKVDTHSIIMCEEGPNTSWTCACSCDPNTEKSTATSSRPTEIETIVRDIRVRKSNTSSARRRKASAPDDRPSARGLGYVATAVLVSVVLGIVLLDAAALKRDCRGLRHNVGHLFRPHNRKAEPRQR